MKAKPPSTQSVSIDDVHIDPANVRIHPDRNKAEIRASLARFGAARSIVLDGNNVIRAGNGTVEQARQLGFEEVLIVEPKPNQIVAVRRSDWTPSEGTGYSIADNQIAKHAEDDEAALASVLQALQSEGFDLGDIGYTDDELEDLLANLADEALADAPPEDPGPQIDRADELQKKWGTALGQLWLIPSKTVSGDHRLLCGDSTKPEDMTRACDGQVQMCVTSPPYWGLRDYQTATWEGGDQGCDHKPDVRPRTDRPRNGLTGSLEYCEAKDPSFRDVCGKCGARRIDSQLGLEATPSEFVAAMVQVFAEVKRVLRDDGTVWCNLGDSFAQTTIRHRGGAPGTNRSDYLDNGRSTVVSGLKPKDLVGIPWRTAFALQADGWYLRSDIIWHKPNPMPESVTDRPTKSHEYIFLMAKQERYYFDQEAVREPHEASTIKRTERGRNPVRPRGWNEESYPGINKDATVNLICHEAGRNTRSVWTITPQPFKEAHFATFPVELAARCIAAGTSEKGACPTCGAPWERVTENHRNGEDWNANNRAGGNRLVSGQSSSDHAPRDYRPSTTLGWRPTCAHDAPPVPCTVLDPFMGAATTIVAAEQAGCLGRGIELSPQYVAIALERLAGMGLEPTLYTCSQVDEQVS